MSDKEAIDPELYQLMKNAQELESQMDVEFIREQGRKEHRRMLKGNLELELRNRRKLVAEYGSSLISERAIAELEARIKELEL